MRRISNIVVFDLDNPNCTISNTAEQIISMFQNTSIPIVNNIYDFQNHKLIKMDDENICGVVVRATHNIENLIYGDIILYEDGTDDKRMKNYQISGEYNKDGSFKIDKIILVEF